MATINKFEDLDVWQKAMNLCKQVYLATYSDKLNKDFALRDQIRKSAISIPSNISEGFERDSINQFIYFLRFAKGSGGELRTQIHLSYSLNYLEETQYKNLIDNCIEINK